MDNPHLRMSAAPIAVLTGQTRNSNETHAAHPWAPLPHHRCQVAQAEGEDHHRQRPHPQACTTATMDTK
eukprot:4295447-Pyramimonas_sp.AAC.1